MSFNIEWTNADALTPKQFTVYESVPVTYSTTTAPFGDLQREVRAGSSRFELLPCPFCGGDVFMMQHPEGFWMVEHKDLHDECPFHVAFFDTRTEAVERWNRRADHD